jgi:diadenosine tetraphosphate (Ap4A) HIT family hydrolase
MSKCPFCHLPSERIFLRYNSALAIFDAFPVSEGHALIIPTRHVESFFQTTAEERSDILILMDKVHDDLKDRFTPDSFNIGINDGVAAGQTVPHLHLHVIPRYLGDIQDPRGGVRWIFPDRAKYWSN